MEKLEAEKRARQEKVEAETRRKQEAAEKREAER